MFHIVYSKLNVVHINDRVAKLPEDPSSPSHPENQRQEGISLQSTDTLLNKLTLLVSAVVASQTK